MKKLYKFYWDCDKLGEISGIFVEEQEDLEGILGKVIYFGDILGKGTEVLGTFTEDSVEVLSEDQEFIEMFEDVVGQHGCNPLDYYDWEDPEYVYAISHNEDSNSFVRGLPY